MKTLIITLVCILSLGFINGATAQNDQKTRIAEQIDSIFHVMIKAAEGLEYDKLPNGVDDRYHAGFITGDSYYAQFDSLISVIKTRSSGVSGQHISIKEKKITVLSETIALLTASGNAAIDLNNGNSFDLKFYWSFVYEKIDNNWKVIQSHQSTVR